ncbi:MAB_1171c family putative transporter [Streptomyces sp. CB03911]|uniref:MAB_1171c family putative transporter n=1 Tax=Streptomyces sp. CB03911 TaxID=1804758 RepID=UPI0009400631|nr:MAB_1171c family putative transporter [Streptomyces sp. CB03911]OKI25057.1 hypothetical protein A6A07_31140 [Streptomyces sp. CB03911]
MYHVYQFTLPALVWALVLWRAPSALAGPRASRVLWGFLVSGAAALTSRPTAVAGPVRALTGSPDLSVLLMHLFGLTACHFAVEYVIAVHGRRPARPAGARIRLALLAAAAAGLTLVFTVLMVHDPSGPPSRVTDAHFGDPAVRLFEGIFYVYMGSASVLAARLFWSNRHGVAAGVLRTGVRLLAAGFAVGAGYTGYRVVFLLRQDSRPDVAGPGVFDPVSEFLPVVMILLLAAGLALPPLGALARWAGHQRALWRLHPLWSDLVAAAPGVAFGPRVGRVRDLFTIGDRTLDVAHRAFEIRDAALVLRDRVAAGCPAHADPRPSAAHPDPARAEAAWLAAVLSPSPDDCRCAAGAPGAWTARTPAEETAWLLRVAAAYRPRGGEVRKGPALCGAGPAG